jgi:protoporphyrinogen IX oxidase
VHLLADFAWMAGLFYLPRLFVYHVEKQPGSDGDATFCVMERRLLAIIMRPAAVIAGVSGIALAFELQLWPPPMWLVLKAAAVAGLVVVHGLLEVHTADFARGGRRRSGRYFRILNEAPTLMLFVIVVLVVTKPFS